MIDLIALQKEIHEWANAQFGERRPAHKRLIGATEEFGELVGWKLEELIPILHALRQLGKVCHHSEKQSVGIRGSYEFHDEKLKDALGDIFIYLIDYCELRGWQYEDIIKETWAQVSKRDWVNDPMNGVARYTGEETIPKGLKYDTQ